MAALAMSVDGGCVDVKFEEVEGQTVIAHEQVVAQIAGLGS